MGFGVAEAQCLTAPPYAAAGIVMFVLAYLGDKYHIRGPLLAGNSVFGLIGMPLLASEVQPLQCLLMTSSRGLQSKQACDSLGYF